MQTCKNTIKNCRQGSEQTVVRSRAVGEPLLPHGCWIHEVGWVWFKMDAKCKIQTRFQTLDIKKTVNINSKY